METDWEIHYCTMQVCSVVRSKRNPDAPTHNFYIELDRYDSDKQCEDNEVCGHKIKW